MGKYDSILLLAISMNVSDEEFLEAASQLDAIGLLKLDGSLTPGQITDRISTQITINRLKKSLKNTIAKAVKGMPIVYIFMVIGAVYMAGGH